MKILEPIYHSLLKNKTKNNDKYLKVINANFVMWLWWWIISTVAYKNYVRSHNVIFDRKYKFTVDYTEIIRPSQKFIWKIISNYISSCRLWLKMLFYSKNDNFNSKVGTCIKPQYTVNWSSKKTSIENQICKRKKKKKMK